jgi:hypothetical protein
MRVIEDIPGSIFIHSSCIERFFYDPERLVVGYIRVFYPFTSLTKTKDFFEKDSTHHREKGEDDECDDQSGSFFLGDSIHKKEFYSTLV